MKRVSADRQREDGDPVEIFFEFPEKKLTEKKMKTTDRHNGERSKLSTIKWSLLILLTGLLGISIATIIFLLQGF